MKKKKKLIKVDLKSLAKAKSGGRSNTLDMLQLASFVHFLFWLFGILIAVVQTKSKTQKKQRMERDPDLTHVHFGNSPEMDIVTMKPTYLNADMTTMTVVN